MVMAKCVVEILDWHPPLKNIWEGYHWTTKRRIKASAYAFIATYCRLASVPNATTPRRATLTIVLGPGQRGGDPDAYWKALLDGLVHCGALVNDSKEWVTLAPVQYERGDRMGTVITLEDIGDGSEK